VMVESEAKEIYENVMLGVIVFGHEHMQAAIQAIKELVAEAGKPAWDWEPEPIQDELLNKIKSLAQSDLQAAYKIHQKQARTHALQDVREKVFAGLNAEATEENPVDENAVKEILHVLELISFAARSSMVSPVSTGVTHAPCVLSRSSLAFYPAHTAVHYLHVERPKLSW